MNLFIRHIFTEPLFYICWVLSVTFSICVHEFSHAAMASAFGDYTARRNGFMSLNPLKVMGTQSLICLALFGIAWGAVPVNPWAFRRKYQPSLVSLAGPLSNLVLAFVFAMLENTMTHFIHLESLHIVTYVFFIACQANCLLFVFNILPIPMLDGWGVIRPFVPAIDNIRPNTLGTISLACILVLFLTPASTYISIASSYIANLLIF